MSMASMSGIIATIFNRLFLVFLLPVNALFTFVFVKPGWKNKILKNVFPMYTVSVNIYLHNLSRGLWCILQDYGVYYNI